jgi:hypothetical protein
MAPSPVAEGPASRRINRTKFSPWTKAVLNKQPLSSQSPSTKTVVAAPSVVSAASPTPSADPEPSRVVSDIVLPSTEPQPQAVQATSARRPLSGFAKIVAAQEQWEKQQHRQQQPRPFSSAGSTSSDGSSSSGDLPAVTPGMKRQPAPPGESPSYDARAALNVPYAHTLSLSHSICCAAF